MRAAESGEKVVQRVVIGEVDKLDLRAPSVLVPFEKIVIADREIEKAAMSDAGRILIVVLRSRRWYLGEGRTELRRRTDKGQWSEGGRMDAIAGKSRLKFLVGGKRNSGGIGHGDRG